METREILDNLCISRKRTKIPGYVDNLYNIYYTKLNFCIKGELSNKDNFMIHMAFTIKLLCRRKVEIKDLCAIKKMAYNTMIIYDIIGDDDDIVFDRDPSKILSICMALKYIMDNTRMTLLPGSCLYDLIPEKKDRDILIRYISTNKICIA